MKVASTGVSCVPDHRRRTDFPVHFRIFIWEGTLVQLARKLPVPHVTAILLLSPEIELTLCQSKFSIASDSHLPSSTFKILDP